MSNRRAAEDTRPGSRFRTVSQALRNTGIFVYYQTPDLRISWAQALPQAWTSRDPIGLTDRDLFSQDVSAVLHDSKMAILAGATSSRHEVEREVTGGPAWYDVWIDADKDAAGQIVGIITTVAEITQAKHREQTLKTLLREVSHRSKNLLAIIQSIASQTGRNAQTIEGFLTRFRGRIQSLAASQDLVTSSNWRGADLRELVESQVSRYSLTPRHAVRYSGERPWLNPNAALHVGLALHELTVNSISYGALSRTNGQISLDVATARDTGGAILTLTWTEILPAGDDSPEERITRKRFGHVALERIVPASLGGTASLALTSDRLVYTLNIPAPHFDLAS